MPQVLSFERMLHQRGASTRARVAGEGRARSPGMGIHERRPIAKGAVMATWTAAQIPDLAGRTAVVTGANSGLGYETAKALARHGATVVMACRDDGRCTAAADAVREAAPSARLEPSLLDLADLDAVRAFARDVGARHGTLDILVNNAGVMAPPRRATTQQGFELQLGTNHLGHFALTGLLLPLLMRTPGSRVVTVSSIAHEGGRIDFDDLQQERGYAPVSYTHLRAHETRHDLVCRLLLEK